MGINPICLSDPWSDSFVIIPLQPIKKWIGIKPMGLNDPWDDYLDIIAFNIDKIILLWINPMDLCAPRDNSIVIIALQTLKQTARD